MTSHDTEKEDSVSSYNNSQNGITQKFPHENKTNVKQLSTDCPVENEYGRVTEDANVLFVDVRTFIPPSSKILKY